MCRHLFRPRAFQCRLCVCAIIRDTAIYLSSVIFCLLFSAFFSRINVQIRARARAHTRYGRMWTSEKTVAHWASTITPVIIIYTYVCMWSVLCEFVTHNVIDCVVVVDFSTCFTRAPMGAQSNADWPFFVASEHTERRRLERNNYMFGGREGRADIWNLEPSTHECIHWTPKKEHSGMYCANPRYVTIRFPFASENQRHRWPNTRDEIDNYENREWKRSVMFATVSHSTTISRASVLATDKYIQLSGD